MKVYIDSDYKCHVSDDGSMRKFDVSFFNGKCDTFIEGYRYIPEGETWTRADGEEFKGVMIAPWKPYDELYKAQLEYENSLYKATLAEAEAAYESGVNSI